MTNLHSGSSLGNLVIQEPDHLAVRSGTLEGPLPFRGVQGKIFKVKLTQDTGRILSAASFLLRSPAHVEKT